MKIGILTYHRVYNYGAFIQCYSLLAQLKKDFPHVSFEVIDYASNRSLDYYKNQLKNAANQKIYDSLCCRNNHFDKCRHVLPLSPFSIISDDYSELIKKLDERYDAVITGSDAIWNWNSMGLPNPYYLSEYKGLKFSYAASVHGTSYRKITSSKRAWLKNALQGYEYIGTRDLSTEKFVTGIDRNLSPHHNCDPTVLLDIDQIPCNPDSLKMKLIASGVDFSKPVIGLMAMDYIGKEIRDFFGNSVQIVAVYSPNSYADICLYDLSPFEWVRVFSFFNVTVTHYFHGTLLSLKNSVPVIPVDLMSPYSAKYISKIKDLTCRCNLEDWYEEKKLAGNFYQRIVRKLGFPFRESKLWEKVNSKIENFIRNPQKERIEAALKQEAQAYQSFRNTLKKYT